MILTALMVLMGGQSSSVLTLSMAAVAVTAAMTPIQALVALVEVWVVLVREAFLVVTQPVEAEALTIRMGGPLRVAVAKRVVRVSQAIMVVEQVVDRVRLRLLMVLVAYSVVLVEAEAVM